jgi:hypothetical protein
MDANPKITVVLSDDLLCHLRRVAQQQRIPLRWPAERVCWSPGLSPRDCTAKSTNAEVKTWRVALHRAKPENVSARIKSSRTENSLVTYGVSKNTSY